MSTGKIHKPELPLTDKQAFLGLNNFNTRIYDHATTTTELYCNFAANEDVAGILFTSSGYAEDRGMYIFGSNKKKGITLYTVLKATGTNWTISATGSSSLKMTNGTRHRYYLFIVFQGSLPTITTTAPS